MHLYPIIEIQLHKRQLGLRHKRSAVLQLLMYLKEVNELYYAANSEHIYAVYVDFKKAFDKVAHEKLKDFSSGGKLLNLLSSCIESVTNVSR